MGDDTGPIVRNCDEMDQSSRKVRRRGKRFQQPPRPMHLRMRVAVVAVYLYFVLSAVGQTMQLPPEIQADRYLLRAEEQIQRQNFPAAKGFMDRILELQQEHDLAIPQEFHFRYGQVLERIGLYGEAIESVTRYLTQSGRDGEHYREAIELLNVLEVRNTIAEMEFVRIPAGEFQMGSTSEEARYIERPLTHVRITQAFELGRYEVTRKQWEAVMGSDPSGFPECGAECPVTNVSWQDVQEFIDQLNSTDGIEGYRLPTEAEWEYAARAGTRGDRYGESLDAIAWYESNSGGKLHPVGQKGPNAFGLHDMLGNVLEWVQDRFESYPGGSVTDPDGGGHYRNKGLIRGGAWNLPARFCRASIRVPLTVDTRYRNLGFRLARSL